MLAAHLAPLRRSRVAPPEGPREHFLRRVPDAAALAVGLLGVAVLLGHIFKSEFWIRIRPWLDPMMPVTAGAFILAGVALAAARMHGGWTVARAGGLALSALAAGVTTGNFILEDLPPSCALPPNTVIAFALAGLSLALVRRLPFASAVLGVGVFTLGAVAALGYAADVTTAFGWGTYTRMAFHSALGFGVLGIGLVFLAFEGEKGRHRVLSWRRPLLVGTAAAFAGVLFWGALRAQERRMIHNMVEATADGVCADIISTTGSIVLALSRLAEHGENVGWDSPADWQKDARLTVGAFRGFEMIEWIDARFVPRVMASIRETARELVRDEDSDRLRRKGLRRARESERAVVIGPFRFADGGQAFRVIVPLLSPRHPEAYLSGVFSAEEALSTLSQHITYGHSLVVLCEGREVFRSEPAAPAAPGRWARRKSLDVPGEVDWEIIVAPKSELLAALATALPEGALVASLLIAVLLALTARLGDMARLRARHLEEAVKERTLELEETMENLRSEVAERRRTEAILRQTQKVGRLVSAELDLDKVVQAVTDAGTELTRAECGCLVYTVTDEEGNTHTRSKVSGARQELMGRVEELRRSKLLAPAFRGERAMRLHDLRENHHPSLAHADRGRDNLPPGVVSLLAVPVISRSGKVWGVLQFGHSIPGRFLARDEEIAESLAAQAAIAMDNAWLYESEHRASEQARATSEAKDNFIHLLGHEVRNPLGSIRSALEALAESARGRTRPEDPPGSADPTPTEEESSQRESRMREIIDRQVDQLTRLTDDLLEMSRIGRGKLTLRAEPLDLGELVSETVESHRAGFEEAGLELSVEIPAGPTHVIADRHRMRQVLDNLLGNARKFTDAGGSVRVRLARETQPGEAMITVQDTGGGIDPEDLSRVFEPFVQTRLARKRATGGLGLGLPIVKGLIEAQGGAVEVRSGGKNRGAEFSVHLPLSSAPAPIPQPEPIRAVGSPRRILVIDDHQDSANALKTVLDLAGNEVEVAYDGRQGIELARAFRPDVLICDIGLPGMDGFEVARELGKNPETESIRLIALTGFGDEDTIRAARAAGFDHHLTKPVETDVLRKLLAEC